MRVIDEQAGEIFVGRDPVRGSVEVQIGGSAANGPRVIRLTRQEARRLAALILFQAARLERPRESWGLPHAEPERKTA